MTVNDDDNLVDSSQKQESDDEEANVLLSLDNFPQLVVGADADFVSETGYSLVLGPTPITKSKITCALQFKPRMWSF